MNATNSPLTDALFSEMRRREKTKGDEGGMSCREIERALACGSDKANKIITEAVESGLLIVRRCRRLNRVGTGCIVPIYFAAKKKAAK